MSWVNHPSYIGPDRRQRSKGLRLLERRRRSALAERPSLASALRSLKLGTIDLVDAAHVGAFRIQVEGAAHVARETQRPDIAGVLDELALALHPDTEDVLTLRPTISYAMAACEDLLVQRAARKPLPVGLRR